MTPDEVDQLAAEYVLGLVEGADARRAENMLESDQTFQAAVAIWSERFAALNETAPEMPVSDSLWSRIAGTISSRTETAAQIAPVLVPDPRNAFRALWRNLAFWRGAGLASTAAAALLGVGLGFVATRPAPMPVLVAVLLTEGGNARPAAVVNTFADGHAELLPLEGIPVPEGRVLEVWTLWDKAVGPRSIGLLDQARRVRLNLDALPKAEPNQLFEITLEPAGGSPTGRPTGPILMKGTTSTAI